MSRAQSDINTEVKHLKDVLEPLIELFVKLHPLMMRERDAMNSRKPDVLEQASQDIRSVLEEIYKTDQLRQRVTARLGSQMGLVPSKHSLKHMDEALGGGSGLLPLRERLTDVIKKAEELNRENQAIFTGVLTATESLLRILKEGTQGPISSYNRLGNRQTGGAFHFLSRQL